MCRYAMTSYKPHYSCFSCRKTFKRKLLVDINRDLAYAKEGEEQPFKCPQCGGIMISMGLDFKSQKKRMSELGPISKVFMKLALHFIHVGVQVQDIFLETKLHLWRFLRKKKCIHRESSFLAFQ